MSKRIVFVGGGTMGSVSPLLALKKKLSSLRPDDEFIWAGTMNGPEKSTIAELGVQFEAIPDAKLPRYLTPKILKFPFEYWRAKKAVKLFLDKHKPDLIVGAGGYTQVPLMREANKRGIPCAIHQLDFQPTLSNVLVAKRCKLITTTFEYHRNKFRARVYHKKISTPNRYAGVTVPERDQAARFWGLDASKPIVLVMGGGTGSKALNYLFEDNLDAWLATSQVIHITGQGRSRGKDGRSGYIRREFMNEADLLMAYAATDLVVSRAGIGAITDFAALSKPVILIPMPDSHQEKNSRHLPLATIEVKEGEDFYDRLHKSVKHLLDRKDWREKLGYELHRIMPTDDGAEWAELINAMFLTDDDE